MACEAQRAALTALQQQLAAIYSGIAAEPKPEQAGDLKAAEPRIAKLNAQMQTAAAALNDCLQALSTAPRRIAGAQPQGILAIRYQNPAFGGGTSSPGWGTRIAGGSFPTGQGFEWKQVTDTPAEYDTTPVGATGWAMFQDMATSDFMFTHPFGLDWEFVCALDQPYYNLCSYPENLSLAVDRGTDVVAARFKQLNLTPQSTVSGTEDVQGNVGKLGFLGVEWENGLVPLQFQAEFNEGDRVAVFGRWIVDVGEDAHTEIHPPLLLASASVYATPPAAGGFGSPFSPKGVQYTRALFTSRAYLSGQTFLAGGYPNPDIYKDGKSDNGHFLEHMIIELAKIDTIILSSSLEAHPKIKQYPFQGRHVFPIIVKTTQPKPPVYTVGDTYVVSFHFIVRSGCSVQVMANDESSVIVTITLNSAGYTPPPLPARQALEVTPAEFHNNKAYDALLADRIAFPLGGQLASAGVETDQYQIPFIDFTAPASPPSVVNVALNKLSALPAGQGISTDNSQPFPVVGWLEVGWGSTGAPHATTGTPVASITTLMDLNGRWASGGTPGPVISVSGNAISVDMSAYKRPTAHGTIVDTSDITVTFPDDKTYTGKLQLPNKITWSNNSFWTKV